MFIQVHRRLREEEGISLIEVLVSILLVGLILSALASNLLASMASARQNESLTQATAIANQQLEELRNARWADLTTAGVGVPVALTPRTVTRGTRTYNVTRTATLEATNYKSYSVRVSWNHNNGPKTLRLDGRRARRSGESNVPPPIPNPFRVLVFNVNPDPVLLDTTGKSQPGTFDPPQPAGTAMLIEVELSEPAASGSVVASWPDPSPTTSLTLSEVAGSGGTKWSGTVPSGQTYTPGWMNFRVTATKAGSTAPATGNTAAYLQAPIQNGPLYVDNNNQRLYSASGTPGPSGNRLCYKDTSLRLRNSNPFYLGLKGLGPDDTVTLARTDQPGVVFPMTYTRVVSSWWWYADVSSSGAGTFTPGANSTWTITYTRSYDNFTETLPPYTFYSQLANGNSAC